MSSALTNPAPSPARFIAKKLQLSVSTERAKTKLASGGPRLRAMDPIRRPAFEQQQPLKLILSSSLRN